MKYPKITIRRTVKTFCRVCHKKLKRVISEFFTENPWNVYRIQVLLANYENDLVNNRVVCKNCEPST